MFEKKKEKRKRGKRFSRTICSVVSSRDPERNAIVPLTEVH